MIWEIKKQVLSLLLSFILPDLMISTVQNTLNLMCLWVFISGMLKTAGSGVGGLGYLSTQMVTESMGGGGHLGESLEGEDSYLT